MDEHVQAVDGVTQEVGSKEINWEMPVAEVFDLVRYQFRRSGKGVQGTERTLKKGKGSQLEEGCAHVSGKECAIENQMGKGGDSGVQYRLKWECELAMWKGLRAKIPRMTFIQKMKAGEDWVDYRKRALWEMRTKWRMMKLPTVAEKIYGKGVEGRPWLGILTKETFQSRARCSQSFDGGRRLGGGTGVHRR